MVDEYEIYFRRRFVVEDGDIGKVQFNFKETKRIERARGKVRSRFERLQQIVDRTGEANLGDQEIVRGGGEVDFRNGDDPRNKSLKPVSVTPVFPDFKVWPQNFVRLTFDEDPTLDVEGVSDAMEDVKEKAMQKAIVKPMMVEDEAGRPDKFISA